MIIVNVIHDFISPLSLFSCNVEGMASLSFPFHPDHCFGQYLHTLGTNAAQAQDRTLSPSRCITVVSDSVHPDTNFTAVGENEKIEVRDLDSLWVVNEWRKEEKEIMDLRPNHLTHQYRRC
ncbi:unnamed protein product [Lupinus luteus]|uniref:Uncharacterized protein n=1 Tax=Lupinus luteus TaxID=3873 RepID=A0AAV1WSD1_LUPLU